MRALSIIIFCLVAAVGSSQSGTAQDAQNFAVEKFHADYVLSKSEKNVSQLAVDEYISALFPDFDQNHGILRALPLRYNDASLDVKVLAVDQKSAPDALTPAIWQYSVYEENDNVVLRIGDAQIYVRGQQSYHIRYTMQNVIRTYENYDEFFWNVNGTQWEQSITATSATVLLPASIANQLTDTICFTGAAGSTNQDCTIVVSPAADAAKVVTVKASSALAPNENLSFALKFDKGTFVVVGPSLWQRFSPIAAAITGTVLFVASCFYVYTSWRKYGKDPKGRGTIIAEYDPPKDTSVLLNDFVQHERLRTQAVTAQIISLATRGFLRIVEEKKVKRLAKDTFAYKLELTQITASLSSEEQAVVRMLFGDGAKTGASVALEQLKNKLVPEVTKLGNALAETATTQGLFTANPAKTTQKFALRGGLLMGAGIVGIILLPISLKALAIGVVAGGVVILLSAHWMPSRTAAGVTLNDYLLGNKLYIGMAEQDRIRFHQGLATAERKQIDPRNPKQAIHLYEALLPYAMLFGLEQSWTRQFSELYATAPSWFQGSGNAFSTSQLASGLSGVAHASAVSFSAPNSSGGSGFSGGSSGGGGGGGGGGGW